MCGRYFLDTLPELLAEQFRVHKYPVYAASYNIAPTQPALAVRRHGEDNEWAWLRWGLVPHWAKDPSIGARLNNARAETVAGKPSFRNAFARRRCLIPACGYYEWQAVPGERKQPWYITLQGDAPMAMGGLWESWMAPDGSVLRTCCVITTGPNEIMAPIHDRMPVIVEPAHWARWLAPDSVDVGDLLAPLDTGRMQARRVSRAVSNARNEGPELIAAA